METMRWVDGWLELLDQTQLPQKQTYLRCRSYEDVGAAISRLSVRGAPAIGAAAAFGLCLGAMAIDTDRWEDFSPQLQAVADALVAVRPTAVNLKWAVDRLLALLPNADGDMAKLKELLLAEAHLIYQEDLVNNEKMGGYGQALIPAEAAILTHCNAGALATAGFGTALGVVRAAHRSGKAIHVYADETRPLLQGARLTAWEMMQEGIPVTLITDNMAGYLMAQGGLDLVIVGADRIAANGDTANKIGTYGVAVLAKEHGLPFYVAAPLSTIDYHLPLGGLIQIEFRNPEEVTNWAGIRVAPEGVRVWNPAFDVTPANLITAIITERGVAYPPFDVSLAKLRESENG